MKERTTPAGTAAIARRLVMSRDGALTAWLRRDALQLYDRSGPSGELPHSTAFDFVGTELWFTDQDRIRASAPAARDRVVVSGLPADEARDLRAMSSRSALVTGAGCAVLATDSRLTDLHTVVRDDAWPVPVSPLRLMVFTRDGARMVDVPTQRVLALRIDEREPPAAAAAILGGRAVAAGWCGSDRAVLRVIAPDTGTIHRVELDPWHHCVFAEDAALALSFSESRLTIVDLRYGRVAEVRRLSQPVHDVAVDARYTRLAVVTSEADGWLSFVDPRAFERYPPGAAASASGEIALSAAEKPSGSDPPGDPVDDRGDEHDPGGAELARDEPVAAAAPAGPPTAAVGGGTPQSAHAVPSWLVANRAAQPPAPADLDDRGELDDDEFDDDVDDEDDDATFHLADSAAPAVASDPPVDDLAVQSWVAHFVAESLDDSSAFRAASSPDGYADHAELVAALAERVRLLVARYLAVHAAWVVDGEGRRSDRGVSSQEVRGFLERSAAASVSVELLDRRLVDHRARVEQRLRATGHDVELPLRDIQVRFRLPEEAMECLTVLFFAETELAFLRALTHAWADFTKKHVTVGFLAELLGTTDDLRKRVLEAFESGAPLMRLGLVQLVDPAEHGLVSRTVRISQRIAWAILRGPAWLHDHADALVRVERPVAPLCDLVLDPHTLQSLAGIRAAVRGTAGPLRYQITGAVGTGRRSLVRALASEAGQSTVTVTLTPDLMSQVHARRAAAAVIAEALVTGSWICIVLDALTPQGEQPRPQGETEWLHTLYTSIADTGIAMFVVSQQLVALPDLDGPCAPLFTTVPTAETQRRLWQLAAARFRTRLPAGLDAAALAQHVSLPPGAIFASVGRTVRTMAATGLPAHTLDAAALLRSVRQELQSRIGTVATRIERKHRPEDLVLPRRTRDKIYELVAFARNRKRVLQDWRLSDKFVYGTSISALFSGPPGTGKTMVASVIAHTLGLEIYRIDLSRVLSRWIGETEKNLATVFDEAERSQAILLFDEADSLFARRTQVQSVQDRYANIETNFLLQRIETYEGIAILTTNFERSIDEAFIRRIRFRVQFEMPSRRERRRIWASLVPASIPTSETLDFDLLARSYKLSGGNIKNAVLRGCVAAAETGKTVSTQLLAACAEMELAESGRLVNERYRSALHVL